MHKENIKSSLRDSILRDIHEKNIQPRARWQYVLLHGALWFTGVITLIIGSFSCAFVLLEFSLPERAYLRWIETQENVGWLLALPYFWGIGMIVALTIGHFIFSKTGRGYRFHASVIAGILILGSLLGGEILYLSRMAHWSDRQMQRFEPRYRDMRQNFARMLPRVEDGVLPLRVTSVSGDTIQGITPDGQNWSVKLDCKNDDCREKGEKIPTGRPIIFEGKMSSKGEFEASEIEFPPKWRPKNIRKKDSFLKKMFDYATNQRKKERNSFASRYKVHTILRVMQLSSKQKIIISSVTALVVLGIVGWYFFSSDQSEPDDIPEVAPVVPESADDIRIRNINLISQSLKQALARGSEIPLPEDSLRVDFGETVLVYQGKVGQELFDALGLNDLVDPVTSQRYDIALSRDKRVYQIIAYLDDVQRSNMHLEKTVFYSVGSEKDLFIRDFAGSILRRNHFGNDSIDISSSEMRKKAGLPTLKSCKDIYAFKSTITTPKSGTYIIDIDGRDAKVFCDMQTDGGGWTLFYANNGYEDSPIAKSYVDMRDTIKTEPVLDLSNYDDKHLAGLLDYSHFTQNGASEILIRNRTGDVKKWVKFTFSTSRALEWALGPLVLGETEYGCISLPRRATWSIVSSDSKVKYDNLTQIMNHKGTSWGVSHEKYLCNSFEIGKNPHIGFYISNSSSYANRARSNEGTGGEWGGGAEYRYFIK